MHETTPMTAKTMPVIEQHLVQPGLALKVAAVAPQATVQPTTKAGIEMDRSPRMSTPKTMSTMPQLLMAPKISSAPAMNTHEAQAYARED